MKNTINFVSINTNFGSEKRVRSQKMHDDESVLEIMRQNLSTKVLSRLADAYEDTVEDDHPQDDESIISNGRP